ncbi:hypothetical protein AVEN_221237-1 [Araneus ventricosus]|uniref:Uncharacterized protein n=1 Tax=Araneus ventricosus TaxID=182803 RepID=A0A4Y2F3T8_ARAVE|nr:hypothetical protein AVEN_221237-1 [Araneus ventricosus]
MTLFKHDSNQNAIIKEIQVINESTSVTFPYIVQRDGYNCTPKAMKRSVPFMRPKDEEKQIKLESHTMYKVLDSEQEMRCNMFVLARYHKSMFPLTPQQPRRGANTVNGMSRRSGTMRLVHDYGSEAASISIEVPHGEKSDFASMPVSVSWE